MVRKVYLAIGCPDQPSIPTITTSDLLLDGGLADVVDRDQMVTLITRILSSKYKLNSEDRLVADAARSTACARANAIIENHCVHRSFVTMIWQGGVDAVSRDGVRKLCTLLQGSAFNPELISICSGSTITTSDEDFFDVNPGMFPVNLFEQVAIIKGCVCVFNTTPSGKYSNLGSPNAVKFAIGRVAVTAVEAWDIPHMFPTLVTLEVDGVFPNGPPHPRSGFGQRKSR